MKKTYGTLAVAAVALMATPALAQIKIGSAGPMTGQYAAFGEQLKRGATMAIEEINAAGDLQGRQDPADHAGLDQSQADRRCSGQGKYHGVPHLRP